MKYFELDGEQHAIHYGFADIKALMDKNGKTRLVEMHEVMQNMPIDEIPVLVKSGFDTAAEINKKKPPFSKDEINDLLKKYAWLSVVCIQELSECLNPPAFSQKKSDQQESGPEKSGDEKN